MYSFCLHRALGAGFSGGKPELFNGLIISETGIGSGTADDVLVVAHAALPALLAKISQAVDR